MDAIPTLVIDDEPPARTRLLALLSGKPDIHVVGVGHDGGEGLALIRKHQPALVFLDVQMPVLDGFSVLKSISPEQAPVTIFVTAYDRYAVAAFEAHAIDYLLKPFSDERFDAALVHAVRAIRAQNLSDFHLRIGSVLEERAAVDERSGFLNRIVIREQGRLAFLKVDTIDWIGAAGVYLELHAGDRTHLYRSSLSALLPRLDPSRFVRTHRSAAVNTDRIKELRPRGHSDYTIVLRDDCMVPLSRAYRSQFERWLGQSL